MFPLPAIPPMPSGSSTWLPVLIRSGALLMASNTSRLLPAAVQAVPCIGAGPISFGITDSIGRTHCDVQFAGSSSVPAHVEMMGLMGMGNNPMVGASVACAVAVSQALAQ